jgi:hypothetical protein
VSGHAAALYMVRVKVKWAPEYKALGALNEDGAYLGELLRGYMKELEVKSVDEINTIRCESAELDGDELFVTVTHGVTGIAGNLYDVNRVHKARQDVTDSHEVVGAALFRLPRNASVGWLCVHVNNRRSCKALLADALEERFKDDFPKLKLEVPASQMGAAFKQAVDQDRVEKVALVRFDRATDRANPSLDKWIEGDVDARLELDITARQRGLRLMPNLLKRYVHGETDVFGEMLIFQGMEFQQAKVAVRLSDGRRRTFNLDRIESGHPMTESIDGDVRLRDGVPTEASLLSALRGCRECFRW